MLSAVGLGWPDGGITVPFAGESGLGWPGEQPERTSSPPLSGKQRQVSRGALLNGQDAAQASGPADGPAQGVPTHSGNDADSVPGSERVRQALAAAVSRGTADGDGSGGTPLVAREADVIVPDVRENPAETPIGRAAEAAVGVRGAASREPWPRGGEVR